MAGHKEFTVVTGLYDLSSRELELKRRNVEFYLEHGQHLFNLQVNIIAFCDSNLVDQILALKRPDNVRTLVISLALEDLPFYQDFKRVKELRAVGSLLNANPNKDTPLFTVLQWSKFYFMEKASEIVKDWQNPKVAIPDGPDYLVWVDFGLHHVAKDYDKLVNIRPSNKLKLLCLRPTYPEEVRNSSFLRFISGRTAAGILSVPINRVEEYAEIFAKSKNNLLQKGFSPLEEEILTYIRVNNPELFDLYYGDYENIIQNFNDECWSGAQILNLQLQSCLQYQDTQTLKIIGQQILNNKDELEKILGSENLNQILTMYLN